MDRVVILLASNG